MKSYYYSAVTWDDIGDSPRAQEFYLKALNLAKETQNNELKGRIYFNLSSIYLYQDMLTISLDYKKKSARSVNTNQRGQRENRARKTAG